MNVNLESIEFESIDLSKLSAFWHSRTIRTLTQGTKSKAFKPSTPLRRESFEQTPPSKKSTQWLLRTMNCNIAKTSEPKEIVRYFRTIKIPTQKTQAMPLET